MVGWKQVGKTGGKLGEKLQQNLHTGIQKGLANISAELSNMIKQLLPQAEISCSRKKISKVCDTGPQGSLQNSTIDSSRPEAYKVHASTVSLLLESDSLNPLLDPLKTIFWHSKLKCPRFEGNDFLGWLMKVEHFFKVVGTQDANKVQIVMIHLDGKALQSHQRYMRTKGLLKVVKWADYVTDMRARFHNTKFGDPMSEIVSLKQNNTIEEYYEEFEALLNLLQLTKEYSLGIFVSNLKSKLSKAVRLFHPKSLTQTLNLAKQMESVMYNLPCKPYSPYKNPTPYNQHPTHVQ